MESAGRSVPFLRSIRPYKYAPMLFDVPGWHSGAEGTRLARGPVPEEADAAAMGAGDVVIAAASVTDLASIFSAECFLGIAVIVVIICSRDLAFHTI